MTTPAPDAVYKDSAGVPLAIGDTVRVGARGTGTIRAFVYGYVTRNSLEARVDDGDPADPDVLTNGFSWACWTPVAKVTRVDPALSSAVRRTNAVVARVLRACPTCAGTKPDCPQCGWIPRPTVTP